MALLDSIGSFLSAGADEAALKAGQIQSNAAATAGGISQRYEDRTIQDINRTAGKATRTIDRATAQALAQRKQAGQFLSDAEERALAEYSAGGEQAVNALTASRDTADQFYQPYAESGDAAIKEQADLQGLNGPEAQAAARARFQTDPGYQFRLEQGVNALDRSATARGGLYSGAAGKALTEYGQNVGSAEYGNYYDRFNPLAQAGQSAAGARASLESQYGSNVANALLGTSQNRAGTISATGAAQADLSRGSGDLIAATGADKANILLGAGQNRINALNIGQEGRIGAVTQGANALAAGEVGAGNARSAGINNLLQLAGRAAGAFAGAA